MRVMQNPVLKMMTRCLVRQYSWRPCVTKMTMAIVNQSDKTNMARKAYGQKKVTITFYDGGNAIFFSILRLTQIIWEIERGDEFCSLPIDVKKIICILFWQSRFAWWYVLTSTKAHHRLLDAILSRFLQMEPVLSIKQTICSMMKRQFPTNVVYIQPLCSWFKCEIGMTNVATMTTAMIRIWKKQKCIIDLSSRRCCCSHWQNFP